MKIGNCQIGLHCRPFVIAEMSGNHNQSLERALMIVNAAADSGAHAIKLQTYTAETMTLSQGGNSFSIKDPNSPWFGRDMHELYHQAHTPWEWHEAIFSLAKKRGLECFSSPFDDSAVDFLESFDPPAYKIASFECIDLPLIRKVARTGKPIIISTGMASISEIDEAITAARAEGNKNIAILKCTSTYPASPKNTNLRTILNMREIFDCEVGISDHTLGIGVSTAAVSFGATIIEKHFTLDRSDGGIDSSFSIEPTELVNLVADSERAWQAIGRIFYGPTDSEKSAVLRRRSLYVVEDLKAGDELTQHNLRRIRPGNGLPPKFYELALGKRVKQDVKRGTPLSWDLMV